MGRMLCVYPPYVSHSHWVWVFCVPLLERGKLGGGEGEGSDVWGCREQREGERKRGRT